jgi:TetR/AcrR family transcriptional repressor of mexJK operon
VQHDRLTEVLLMSQLDTRRVRDPKSTQQRILTAAAESFLSNGYANTSLENVAAAAGVTKPTVYNHFSSKANLFRCVVEGYAGKRLQTIDQLDNPTGDTRADLLSFSETFVQLVFSNRAQRWDRLAAAESLEHPEVGEMFFDAGPQKILNLLSKYLSDQKKAKRLCIKNPQRAAEQLIGLLLGVDMLRSIIGKPTSNKSEQRRRCCEAVDIFLATYGDDHGV